MRAGWSLSPQPEIARLVRLSATRAWSDRYENEVVGFNTRMTDMHAAIGRVQLNRIAGWTWQRQRECCVPEPAPGRRDHSHDQPHGARHVFHQYTIRVPEDRDGFASALRDEHRRRIGSLLPDAHPPLGTVRLVGGDLPETDRAARECLSLPVHPSLTERRPGADRHRRQFSGEGWSAVMRALRAGLIGLGMMGRNHARVLSSLDGVELVAVADPLGDPHSWQPAVRSSPTWTR